MKYKREQFQKHIQNILENFQGTPEARRQIFSQIMEYAESLKNQQTTEKAIPNDKTSESSESDT